MVRSKLLRNAGRAGVWMTAVAIAGWLAGCGSDGTSKIIPGEPLPQLEGKLTGVVQAPFGVYAKADELPGHPFRPFSLPRLASARPAWSPLDLFGTPAFAYPGLHTEPVGIGVLVSLSEVNESDAADGVISTPLPIAQNARTNADGIYAIVNDAIDRIESCRLMVSIGNARNGDLSRAFIYAENTDVDPTSEAVVRAILNRLTQAPAVQLCDFSREGLKYITEKAIPVAYPAQGATVEEINNDAYRMVSRSCSVLDAIDAVTQTIPENRPDCVG